MRFFLADTVTLIGAALAIGVDVWFGLIPSAVGANQLLISALERFPMSKFLDQIPAAVAI